MENICHSEQAKIALYFLLVEKKKTKQILIQQLSCVVYEHSRITAPGLFLCMLYVLVICGYIWKYCGSKNTHNRASRRSRRREREIGWKKRAKFV